MNSHDSEMMAVTNGRSLEARALFGLSDCRHNGCPGDLQQAEFRRNQMWRRPSARIQAELPTLTHLNVEEIIQNHNLANAMKTPLLNLKLCRAI